MKAVDNDSQVPFLPFDLILFGQLIPANQDVRFSL